MIQYPNNPYMVNPYMQQAVIPPAVQQMLQQQQQPPVMQQQAGGSIRVSGRDEAMNRFLMMHPANMLVPGFISDPLFDIDGKHFHTLSIEQDGRRNLETFVYYPDNPEQVQPQDYVSRSEFQSLVDRIDQMTGTINGIYEPVQGQPAQQQQPIE